MSDNNYIPEKELDKVPKSISIEQLDVIKKQMESSICKIECPRGGFGTAFFCKIRYPDELHYLPVLITNNHVLNHKDIMSGNFIFLSMNNDSIHFNIYIDNSRKTFTNEIYDITIIEIKKEDRLKGYSLLEIDDILYKNEPIDVYKNKTIYLIHYPKGNRVEYSLGIIQTVNLDDYTIEHLCNTTSGSSGCPIINLITFKVIGLHKGYKKGENWNVGILIKKAIDSFYEKNLYQKKKDLNIQPIVLNSDRKETSHNIFRQNRHINKTPQKTKSKQLENINLAKIELQQKRLKEVQEKLKLIQQKQQQLQSRQRERALQHQQNQNRPQFGQNLPNSQSINNKHFLSKSPSLEFGNKNNKLVLMALIKNEAIPQYNDFQEINLGQQYQELQYLKKIDGNQECQSQEEIQKKEFKKIANQSHEIGGIHQTSRRDNINNEVSYLTEDGRVIFRNGLLRGIIHTYSEIDQVVNKIQDILLKGVTFTLVYKAFDVWDSSKTFHEKCDEIQMSLILIETDEDVRFGGFTTKNWGGNCLKKFDNSSFVFSLDKNKIYNIIPNEPAIGCYPKFGPVFFGCQIRIYDQFFTEGGTTCRKGLNLRTTEDFELNNGVQKYLIKDIEVYRIDTVDI